MEHSCNQHSPYLSTVRCTAPRPVFPSPCNSYLSRNRISWITDLLFVQRNTMLNQISLLGLAGSLFETTKDFPHRSIIVMSSNHIFGAANSTGEPHSLLRWIRGRKPLYNVMLQMAIHYKSMTVDTPICTCPVEGRTSY